jgi:galactonate dehydratase
MSLSLNIRRVPDPQGHNPALLIRGDWLIVEISDGRHTGRGEASLSGNDDACEKTVNRLFHRFVKDLVVNEMVEGDTISCKSLSPEVLKALSCGPFSAARNFVEATAISGIDQALWELAAKQAGLSVSNMVLGSSWKGRVECSGVNGPPRKKVPVYATINRALTNRTLDDYLETAESALRQGFTAIKCAPFEKVEPGAGADDQRTDARYGLEVLSSLRERFSDLSIRIDFHERFRLDVFLEILPEIEMLSPFWIEAPVPIGEDYTEVNRRCRRPIALGELYFRFEGFEKIIDHGWADIIMPDVAHIGGVGPLREGVTRFSGRVELSFHNAGGPIGTAASLHAASLTDAVTSLEIPLIADESKAYYLGRLEKGYMRVPEGRGWGEISDL